MHVDFDAGKSSVVPFGAINFELIILKEKYYPIEKDQNASNMCNLIN